MLVIFEKFIRKKYLTAYFIGFIGVFYFYNAFSQCNADRITKELIKIKKSYNIPAMAMRIQSPNCHYSFNEGWLTIKKNNRVNIHTKFGVGSITKTFVSTLILMLQSEGKIKLDDNLGRWFPQYPKWKNIQVVQLLHMTSGIFNYFEDVNYNKDLNTGFKKSWTRDQLIRLAYHHTDYFPPGGGWNYSDTNYLLLADIIEKITNHSLEHDINKNIFKKFSLNNSFYTDNIYPNKIIKTTAIGYLNHYPLNRDSGHNIGAPAAAMLMSAQDLESWIDDLFFKKVVLPKKQLEEMLKGVNIPNNYEGRNISKSKYGLGVPMTYSKKYGLIYWYTGITPWYTSVYVYIPKKRTVIIVETSFN